MLSIKSTVFIVNFYVASTSACLYYCGLAGTFLVQFLHEVFQTCNALLISFTEGELKPPDSATSSTGAATNDGLPGSDLSKISGDKVQQLFDQLICYLPLVKVWYDWLSCQWQLWSNFHLEIKNEIVYVAILCVCVYVCVCVCVCVGLAN